MLRSTKRFSLAVTFATATLVAHASAAQNILSAAYTGTITSVDAEGRPITVLPGDTVEFRFEYDADAPEFSPPSGQFFDALLKLEVSFPRTGEYFATGASSIATSITQIDNLGVPNVFQSDNLIVIGDLVISESISGFIPIVAGVGLLEILSGVGAPDLVTDQSQLPTMPPDVASAGTLTFSVDLRTPTQSIFIEGGSVQPLPEPDGVWLAFCGLSTVAALKSRARYRDAA